MDTTTLLSLGLLEDLVTSKPFFLNFTLANYTNHSAEDSEGYLRNERVVEGLYLMMVAVVGIFLNLLMLFSVCICGPLRQLMNSFIVHGCLLDTFKSALCVPFALTLLNSSTPAYCDMLGTTYVVGLTASMFNVLGMVAAEAYTFHVHNLNENDPDQRGAVTCVLFGIVIIYIGSIILHLGPTLIGGDFEFNRDIGNCIFAYGEIQNFIVQLIWIIIVTMTQLIIFRYIFSFYNQLKANQRFRITALARNAAAYTKGEAPSENIYDVIARLKRRLKVIFGVAMVYVICWYPLFFLTIVDYKYLYPRYLYRILTVIAWSHSLLSPLILLTLDKSFGLCYQIRTVLRTRAVENSRESPSKQLLTAVSRDSFSSEHHTHMNNTNTHNINKVKAPGSASTIRSMRMAHAHMSARNSPLLHKQGSVHSSEHELVYEKVNLQLQEVGASVPGPSSDVDTIESRINQSRETDLLYETSPYENTCSPYESPC